MSNDELVLKITNVIRTHVNPKQGMSNLKRNQDIVPGIVTIIKNSVGGQATTNSLVQHAPVNDLVNSITKLIRNKVALTPNTKAKIVERLNTNGNQSNELVQKILQSLRQSLPPTRPAIFSPSSNMPPYGPETKPNFVPPVSNGVNNNGRPKYAPPPPGYVLTTRNNRGTGYYLNKVPAGPVPAGPVGPVPPPAAPRNYSKLGLRELMNARVKYPANAERINKAIRELFDQAIRELKYESGSRRARKIGELLRLLPRNFSGRRNATSLVINNVRNTRNERELQNLASNLGRVSNENIARAFAEQKKRLKRKTNEGSYRRAEEGRNLNEIRRRRAVLGGGNVGGYGGGSGGGNNLNEIRRRRAVLGGGNVGGYGGGSGGGNNLNEIRRRRAVMGTGNSGVFGGFFGGGNRGGNNLNELRRRRMVLEGGAAPPPPLPFMQQNAINNAGGIPRALNTVAAVPGGAPEVAKAAEALNETGGNVAQAINIKGASPAAINAVQKLGGKNNAVNVLEGLNTMSQTTETRKRKAARTIARPKKRRLQKPRLAALNKVINSVKKQKLISIIAHNVTKTHEIHPNDEKLKKYYKKIVKANILRTPFAKIVRKAARKN